MEKKPHHTQKSKPYTLVCVCVCLDSNLESKGMFFKKCFGKQVIVLNVIFHFLKKA